MPDRSVSHRPLPNPIQSVRVTDSKDLEEVAVPSLRLQFLEDLFSVYQNAQQRGVAVLAWGDKKKRLFEMRTDQVAYAITLKAVLESPPVSPEIAAFFNQSPEDLRGRLTRVIRSGGAIFDAFSDAELKTDPDSELQASWMPSKEGTSDVPDLDPEGKLKVFSDDFSFLPLPPRELHGFRHADRLASPDILKLWRERVPDKDLEAIWLAEAEKDRPIDDGVLNLDRE